jgi:hypothetical protein
MRHSGVMLGTLLGILTFAGSGVAAPIPGNVLFGTIAATSTFVAANSFCELPTALNGFPAFASSSEFRQDSQGVHIDFVQPAEYYGLLGGQPYDTNFGGWALLKFTQSTSGTVILDKPAWTYNIKAQTWSASPNFSPTFSNYNAVYNSGTGILTVTFRMTSGPCTLGISATYHNFG